MAGADVGVIQDACTSDVLPDSSALRAIPDNIVGEKCSSFTKANHTQTDLQFSLAIPTGEQ